MNWVTKKVQPNVGIMAGVPVQQTDFSFWAMVGVHRCNKHYQTSSWPDPHSILSTSMGPAQTVGSQHGFTCLAKH